MSQNKAAKRHTASLVMLRTGTFRHKVNIVRRSIKNVGTFDSHNSNKLGIGNIELYEYNKYTSHRCFFSEKHARTYRASLVLQSYYNQREVNNLMVDMTVGS